MKNEINVFLCCNNSLLILSKKKVHVKEDATSYDFAVVVYHVGKTVDGWK